MFALRKIAEVGPARLEPFAPGSGCRQLALDLVVFDEPAGLGVDEEHLARAQPPLAHDEARFDVEHADLTGQEDEAIARDHVAPRTQTVPVEGRPDEGAVGEHQRGRAVPRLHQHGMVLIEVAACRVDVELVLVGLRDGHHHGVRKRTATEGQQFDDLVERRRVARARGDDGEDRWQVAQELRLQLRLAGAHPVAVALHCVDLAVVGEHTERLCERPGWEGVGRIPGMHQRQPRSKTSIRQVRIERLELEGGYHPLVYERAAAERGEVHLKFTLGALAQAESLPIQGDARERGTRIELAGACEEHLLEERRSFPGQASEAVRMHGNLTPPENLELFAHGQGFDAVLHLRTLLGVGRQEGHPDRVPPGLGQLEAHDRAEERVRDLGDDARAVTGPRIGPDRSAVFEVAKRVQRRIDDVVTGGPPKRGDHREPAGVVFAAGVIESGCDRNRTEA